MPWGVWALRDYRSSLDNLGERAQRANRVLKGPKTPSSFKENIILKSPKKPKTKKNINGSLEHREGHIQQKKT